MDLDKKFDKVINTEFLDTMINYGIIEGNNKIFLIKSGLNGSMFGYQYKYLNIATEINEKFGFTVICASNPDTYEKFDNYCNPLVDAFNVIKSYVNEKGFDDYEVYYMGNSNGGYLGAMWGCLNSKIKMMLLVNTPLFKNVDLMNSRINNSLANKIVLIYGSLDPSIRNINFFDTFTNENVICEVIEGEDHNFSKGVYDFKKLPFEYLFS